MSCMLYASACMSVRMFPCIHTYINTCICIHKYIHTDTNMCNEIIHMYIRTHIIYMHARQVERQTCSKLSRMCKEIKEEGDAQVREIRASWEAQKKKWRQTMEELGDIRAEVHVLDSKCSPTGSTLGYGFKARQNVSKSESKERISTRGEPSDNRNIVVPWSKMWDAGERARMCAEMTRLRMKLDELLVCVFVCTYVSCVYSYACVCMNARICVLHDDVEDEA